SRAAELSEEAATYLSLAAAAVIFALYVYVTADSVHGRSRYPARVFVVLQTLALAWVCVGLFAIGRKQQPRADWASTLVMNVVTRFGADIRRGVVAFVAISIVAHGYATTTFVGAWIALNREIEQIVTGGAPVPDGFALASLEDGRVTFVVGAEVPTRAFGVA